MILNKPIYSHHRAFQIPGGGRGYINCIFIDFKMMLWVSFSENTFWGVYRTIPIHSESITKVFLID